MDKANNKELLQFILDSISMIKKRFNGITSSDDFMYSEDGMTRLDAKYLTIKNTNFSDK